MERGKHNNWGSSSKEIDIDDPMAETDDEDNDDNDNDNTGIGRTYECSYCKRGFTNAQALGGHMNIHRKDKAKVKHPTFSSSISYKSEEASTYYSTYIATQGVNHQAYYNPRPNPNPNPNPNPRSSQPSIHHGNNDFPLFGMYHEEHLGTDLSLRINSSRTNNRQCEEKKKKENYDVIDLELRLGYDP